MAGLSSTGFAVKTIDEILEELSQSLHDNIDPNLDTDPESVIGQFIGIFAERERIMWLLLRDIWSAFTPGGASGNSLTQLALLTGTLREPATFSTVTATVNLDAGVTLPAGSQASVDEDPTAVFETVEDITNPGVSPGSFAVDMQATVTGPVRAPAGTLTVIVTPFVGWNAVTNSLDATEGQEIESDPDLRERRELELRAIGSSNLDAIIADVDRVTGVVATAGSEDLDEHTFNIVVWDGTGEDADDNEIAQAIWDSKPAGIESIGAESGTAQDASGEDRTISFDRADQREIYLEIDVTTDPDTYPVDGDDQIKQALVDYADENYGIGHDVIPSALYASIHSVSGVVNVTAIRLGFTVNPVGTAALTIAADEIALFDTSRIEVTSV